MGSEMCIRDRARAARYTYGIYKRSGSFKNSLGTAMPLLRLRYVCWLTQVHPTLPVLASAGLEQDASIRLWVYST